MWNGRLTKTKDQANDPRNIVTGRTWDIDIEGMIEELRPICSSSVIGGWLWAIAPGDALGYALGASRWVVERWVGRMGLIAAVVVFSVAWLSLRRARRRSA
jgi:hypothetical protein